MIPRLSRSATFYPALTLSLTRLTLTSNQGVKPSSGQSGFSRSEGPWPTQRPEPTARLPGAKAAGAVVKKPVSVGVDIVQSVRTFLGQRSSASTLTVFRDQDKDRSGKIEAKVRLTVILSMRPGASTPLIVACTFEPAGVRRRAQAARHERPVR